MRIVTRALGAIVISVSCGCAYNPPLVTVEGAPAELEKLAGEWQGEYAGAPKGRRGSIVFKLVAGENHAHGDVLMIPEGSDRPYLPYQREEPGQLDRLSERAPRVLTIRFVRAAEGSVSGTLDSYWDPDRNCEASTTFRGYIEADIVEGTFISICESGVGQTTGQWKVSRKRR